MVLTAYIDESGKDDASPVFILAGFVGNERHWRQAEIEFTQLLYARKVSRFHAHELKRETIIERVFEISERYVDYSFAVVINKDDFHRHYKDPSLPGRKQRDSLYGLCYRAAIIVAGGYAIHCRNRGLINVIMDHGHHNAGGAVQIHKSYKEKLGADGSKYIGALSFLSIDDCPLLSFADAIAYIIFKTETTTKPALRPFQKPRVDPSRPVRIALTPQQLAIFRENEWLGDMAGAWSPAPILP